MSWFEKLKAPKIKPKTSPNSSGTGALAPEDEAGRVAQARTQEQLWIKCTQCGEILQAVTLKANDHICLQCGFHFRIGAWQRIELMTQDFQELYANLTSGDPLKFSDVKPYAERIRQAQTTTRMKEAFVMGIGNLKSRKSLELGPQLPFALGVFEFKFMGGSMGSVVGEKICRLFEVALERRLPVVIICSSGGARMQEGILSLMQMARTSSLVGQLKKAGLPFFTVLSDPTTGGVAASFAMQADVILAEPNALIGFAGPRVIGQTMRQDLPAGFQRSEFLLKHGMIDRIVSRRDLCSELAVLFSHLNKSDETLAPESPKKKKTSTVKKSKSVGRAPSK